MVSEQCFSYTYTNARTKKSPTDSILLVTPMFIVSGIPLPTIFYILSPSTPSKRLHHLRLACVKSDNRVDSMDTTIAKQSVKFWVQQQADVPDQKAIFSDCLLGCQYNGKKQNKTKTINHPLLVENIMTQWEIQWVLKHMRQQRRHSNKAHAIYQQYCTHHQRAVGSYWGETFCMKV